MKIGFRALCIHCDCDLHVCKGCRYFCLGKSNDCLVPGTEFIQDRERANLCEEFKPKISSQNITGKDSLQKKKFDDLFKTDYN